MSTRIKIVAMSLHGFDVPITPGLAELCSNPSDWTNKEYVEPDFIKKYSTQTERNEKGFLVTTYKKLEVAQ